MTKTIRLHTGLGLAEAKHCTDQFLEGEKVVLDFPSVEAARTFADDLEKVGVETVLEP